MTAEPYDERAVDHLYWAVFCGSFYIFVDFTSTGWSNAPFCWAFVIARYYESPSRKESPPGGDFDRDSIFHALKRVMNSPVVLGVVGFGWRTGPVCIGRMVVGVLWTLSQRSIPG